MKQRVTTAVIALIIFIPVIVYGGWLIDIAGIVLGLIAVNEVLMMKKLLLVSPEAIIADIGVFSLIAPLSWFGWLPLQIDRVFVFFLCVLALLIRTVVSRNRFSFDDAGAVTLAMLYIGFGFYYFIAARGVGVSMLLYILFVVWSTDSGAYMIGKRFGKNKLAPHISPNKTWEGSVGGTVVATIIGSVFLIFYPTQYNFILMVLLTLIFSITGQFGDLVESALKRYFSVKDSGNILPGHGGILDRFDSMLLVLPIIHLFGLI
ncbi:phosphatidate cytidylyltransferase [Pediococcus parvulus]|uniref:phosphatidate cytidylyltransferase n=1 Tax=Pediococcus parvulus TaxID=54062 RepID=UPI0021A6BF32|nr:phosphatidate cytidylyltransferase [Pediococcus parvulus]MCT3034214.1 phosphatidate cytidylyltransferase [Pediococcus parvulus]